MCFVLTLIRRGVDVATLVLGNKMGRMTAGQASGESKWFNRSPEFTVNIWDKGWVAAISGQYSRDLHCGQKIVEGPLLNHNG